MIQIGGFWHSSDAVLGLNDFLDDFLYMSDAVQGLGEFLFLFVVACPCLMQCRDLANFCSCLWLLAHVWCSAGTWQIFVPVCGCLPVFDAVQGLNDFFLWQIVIIAWSGLMQWMDLVIFVCMLGIADDPWFMAQMVDCGQHWSSQWLVTLPVGICSGFVLGNCPASVGLSGWLLLRGLQIDPSWWVWGCT